MSGPRPDSRPPILYLNGLRGIAILMVIMIHVSQLVVGMPGWATNLTFYGVRGVQLFFIVSGLTLALAHKNGPLRLGDFAARRFFRVAPMFYAGVALYLSLAAWTPLVEFMPRHATVSEVLRTIMFVHGWSVDANNKIVPGGWSIAAEAMFYCVFPLLLWQLQRPKSYLLLLIAIYVLAGVSYVGIRRLLEGDPQIVQGFAFNFWVSHLPAFATGCWLSLEVSYNQVSRSVARIIACLAVAAVVIDSQLRGHSNLLVSIILLSTFVWAVGKCRPAFLESRVLIWIGEISFSLYILHFAVLSTLSLMAPRLAPLPWPVRFITIYAITIVVGSAAAATTYRFIEKPLIRLGRNIFRSTERRWSVEAKV